MKVLERFDVTGKKAVVTGGNRGLGKAFAAPLAEAGARVVIVARDARRNAATERELTGQGLAVSSIDADITHDPEGIIQRAVDELGGIDILVNNAGTQCPQRILAGDGRRMEPGVRPECAGAMEMQPRRQAYGPVGAGVRSSMSAPFRDDRQPSAVAARV